MGYSMSYRKVAVSIEEWADVNMAVILWCSGVCRRTLLPDIFAGHSKSQTYWKSGGKCRGSPLPLPYARLTVNRVPKIPQITYICRLRVIKSIQFIKSFKYLLFI